MSGIGPGDLVTWDGSACCECADELESAPEIDGAIVIGRAYQVVRVCHDPSYATSGIWLVGQDPDGMCICGFRKIDKADDQFSETIRACRPIREREAV